MLIPFGGYNSSTSLREVAGIACGALFGLAAFYIVGMAYLVACIFVAEFLFGDSKYFVFVFFGIAMLAMLVNRWKAKMRMPVVAAIVLTVLPALLGIYLIWR